MKTFRKFLTTPDLADSYVKVGREYDDVYLKMADCEDILAVYFRCSKPKYTRASLKKLAILEYALTMIRKELESKLNDS